MYKVLRREYLKEGNLVSCVVGTKSGGLEDWKVTYIPNTWTRAKKGKIIVCKTLEAAKYVYRVEGAHEIWRCQTKKAVELPRLASLIEHLFEQFWKGVQLVGWDTLVPCAPTYGADTIKLTKKVWPR